MTILPAKRAIGNEDNEESTEGPASSSPKDRSNRHRDDINGNSETTASTSRRPFPYDNECNELTKRFKESNDHRDRRNRDRQKHRDSRIGRKQSRHSLRQATTENTNTSDNSNVNENVVPGPSNDITEKKDFIYVDEDGSGCNSEDEYDLRKSVTFGGPTEEEWTRRDAYFSRCLSKLGFEIKKMHEDGACLFRAIADQVYGDQELHSTVRSQCMDYIVKNQDFFAPYVTEDFHKYVERKRQWNVHGNHLEIQALSEMYNRTIEVYCYHTEPINIFNASSINSYEPIRVSYHRMCHYNSITNPKKPSVLVGLGLPNYCTRCDLDRRDVHDAVRQSEELLIEQTMLEDKIKATDWEATNEQMEEEIARQSYIQFYQDAERRLKTESHSTATASATATATATAGSSSTITSGMCCSPRSSRRGSVSPKGSMSPKGDASPKLHLSQTSSPRHSNLSDTGAVVLPYESTSSIGTVEFTEDTTTTTYKPYPIEEQNTEAISNDVISSSSATVTRANGTSCRSDDYHDWNETIMAQVLAESHLTYFDDLKRQAKKRNGSPGPSTSQ